MEFKGTKGKWYYEQDKEYPTLHNIWSDTEDNCLSQGILISMTCYAPLSQANALLISKAPEMLDMLERIAHGENVPSVLEIRELIKSATEL